MEWIKKLLWTVLLIVISLIVVVCVFYPKGVSATVHTLFNICVYGFVGLILLIMWSKLGLKTMLSSQFRETNPYQASIRLIDTVFLFLFLSIGVGLAFFFLGFESNNLSAYNKDNDYNWLLPSDIIRFPLDQFRIDNDLQKPIPLTIDLTKSASSNNPDLVHCFVTDITGSTLKLPKRNWLEAELLKEIDRRPCSATTVAAAAAVLKLKDSANYTIPERLAYIALSQMGSERTAVFFYGGEHANHKGSTLTLFEQNSDICFGIKTYFDLLDNLKSFHGGSQKAEEKTNFVSLLPEISTKLTDFHKTSNKDKPADICLNIISDFQDDINNEDNLKKAISEFAKKSQIKKINLIIIPLNPKSTSINPVLQEFIPRTFQEQFKNKIGVFSAIEGLNSLTTLLKAVPIQPTSKVSFYYSHLQDNKAITNLEVNFPKGGHPIFELKSEQPVENNSVVLKLRLRKENVMDSIELKPNEPLIFPDISSLGNDAGIRVEATFTGINYTNAPKFTLCITDKLGGMHKI